MLGEHSFRKTFEVQVERQMIVAFGHSMINVERKTKNCRNVAESDNGVFLTSETNQCRSISAGGNKSEHFVNMFRLAARLPVGL